MEGIFEGFKQSIFKNISFWIYLASKNSRLIPGILFSKYGDEIGTLKGIRTPVARMKTWYPRPLDDEGIKWSGCSDLNRGPPAPKAGALPNCATARCISNSIIEKVEEVKGFFDFLAKNFSLERKETGNEDIIIQR